MTLDKFQKKSVNEFLATVKATGVVCKQDILSLEENVEGVISSEMNINLFTTLPSATGVNELIPGLESLVSTQEEEQVITIDVLLSNLTGLKNQIKRRISQVNSMSEPHTEVIDNVINSHFLSRYYGSGEDKTMEDLCDKNIEDLSEEINYIVDMLTKDRSDNHRMRAMEIAHEIATTLYGKPINAYSILRMTLNNKLTIHMEESEITEVNLKDFIVEFIVNKRMYTVLLDLFTEVNQLQTSLVFDEKYDNSIPNNESVFTYDYLDKKITNLSYLLKDDVSFHIIRVFQKLLER